MPGRTTFRRWIYLALTVCLPISAQPAKQVQAIFDKSCRQCHGASVQLSKLDLRTRDGVLNGGVHGPAVSPGNPDNSRLYRMVAGLEQPTMPMGGRLTADEIRAIREWIAAGAPWTGAAASTGTAAPVDLEAGAVPPETRNYWAFRKPVRAPAPSGYTNPIDAFLDQARKQHGLKPAPPADPTTLVRRAYLDLIGLPPTPSEVDAYVNDRSPHAWPKLIDRLLESPHYGERWGRHWLDVARYADSNGYEHDFDRPNAWRYRDYVIGAFNQDKPFDTFLREQIAGDELETVTHDSLIATGFLRNYAKVGYREKDNPEFRYEYLDDMIATIGRGILGLTVQCARCHNHKFDPIPQKDYYRLQASLFGYVEVDHPLTTPAVAATYEAKLADVNKRINEVRAQIRTIEQPYRQTLLSEKYKKFPPNVQEAIATPEDRRTPGQVLLANQVIRTVSVGSAEIDRIMSGGDLARKQALLNDVKRIEQDRPAPIPIAMGITDGDYRFTPDGPGDEPAPGKGIKQEAIDGSYLHKGPGRYQAPPSYFLIRGDVNSRGSLIEPGFVTVATSGSPPTALPPANGHTSGRRRALAEWLVSPDNPLTARVMVNRLWHHHFGRGIVATLDNFGKMGELPTHPELLDWLAAEFVERGWSIKQMHRLIMTSDAYRMSSQFADAENMNRDAENRYLWRYRPQRLDAEAMRDSILAVSGALNREIGGPPVFPPLQKEVLEQMLHGIWRTQNDGPEVWRRSVYIYRKRGLPFPMLESFDLPDQNISCGARAVSTVPTQALMLLNDEFVLKQARLFAERVKEAAPNDVAAQIDLAFRVALARAPTAREQEIARAYVQPLADARGSERVSEPRPSGSGNGRALEGLTHVLLNTNEFAYQR